MLTEYVDPDPVKNRALFAKKSKAARNTLREVGKIQPESSKTKEASGIMASSPQLMRAVQGPPAPLPDIAGINPRQGAVARPPAVVQQPQGIAQNLKQKQPMQNVMSGSTAFLHDGGPVNHTHPKGLGSRSGTFPSGYTAGDNFNLPLPSLDTIVDKAKSVYRFNPSRTASDVVSGTQTPSQRKYRERLAGDNTPNNQKISGPKADEMVIAAKDAKKLSDALISGTDEDIRLLSEQVGGFPMEALNNPERRKAMADAIRKAKEAKVTDKQLDAAVTEEFPAEADQVAALAAEDQLGMLASAKLIKAIGGRITNPSTGQDLGPTMGARFGEAAEEQAKAGLGLAMAREKDAAALERQKESGQATREAAAIRAMGTTSAAKIKAANENFFDTGMADAYLKLYGEISSSASGQVMSPQEIHKQIKDTNPDIAKEWEYNAGASSPDEVRPIFLNTPEGYLNEVLWNIKTGRQMEVTKEALMKRLKTDGLNDDQLKEVSDALEARQIKKDGGVSDAGQPVN